MRKRKLRTRLERASAMPTCFHAHYYFSLFYSHQSAVPIHRYMYISNSPSCQWCPCACPPARPDAPLDYKLNICSNLGTSAAVTQSDRRSVADSPSFPSSFPRAVYLPKRTNFRSVFGRVCNFWHRCLSQKSGRQEKSPVSNLSPLSD